MSEDFAYQYSFRLPGIGGQQGLSMVNVRAADAAGFDTALDELLGSDETGPGLVSKLLEVDRLVAASAGISQQTGTPAQAVGQPTTPAATGTADDVRPGGKPRPAGPAPTAPSGQPAYWKAGVSQAGKPYGGWVDPADNKFLPRR